MEQKKKKNIFAAIIMFLLVIIISSCGSDSESEEVKKRLEGYCENIKKFELDETSKYLGIEPDYMVDMNENVLNMFMDIFRDSVSEVEYTIENIEIDETQEIFSWANVTVRFRYIDYSEVMSVSLEHLENELETGAISQDASDEEIYQYLYEIFIEEQKSSDKEWNEVAIKFVLAKNRNKSNPVWYINSIPEDISTILTCNTEASFEKYGETSKEMGDDGVEIMFAEVISKMAGTYTDIEGYGIMVNIELNENGLADITFVTDGYEPDYIFENCAPMGESLEIEIWDKEQQIYLYVDEEGYLGVSGCEMKTYNSIFEKTNTTGNNEYGKNIETATPKEQIFSGGKEDYPIYVYRRDTEYITISRYIFMGDFTDLVDITLKSEVGDSSGQKELEVRRPSFEEDEYSLTFCDWEYDNLHDPIVIEFAGDMSYIDVTANWNASVTDEQSFYAGRYELENIYSEEEYVNLYLLD